MVMFDAVEKNVIDAAFIKNYAFEERFPILSVCVWNKLFVCVCVNEGINLLHNSHFVLSFFFFL